ncbi:beta-mannosidase [Vibrio paucivorans]
MLDFNGIWTLSSPQHPEISVPMTFPGDQYSALITADIIPDPYYASNEQQVQWVGLCEWRASKSLTVTENDLAADKLILTVSKVDTFATLYINGDIALTCSNAFQIYQADIQPLLKLGSNQLEWVFQPAAQVAKDRANKLPFPIPWAEGNNQIPFMNTVRKPQCHTGWDWGICLPVCGIFATASLTPIKSVYFERVDVDQHWTSDTSVTLKLRLHHSNGVSLPFHIEIDGKHYEGSTVAGCNKTEFECVLNNPKLWWPNGYGEPHLYELSVRVEQQIITKSLGLRRLSLRTNADAVGSEMVFVVNGKTISCKGANWIPMDALPQRTHTLRYEQLLGAAKDANMNMIRVWGGGDYEHDEFYQTCDKLGLLVWQDLMFACAQYPSTTEFLDDVKQEVTQQVQRLKHHACIALWCGDNEVIGSLNWYPESRQNREKYLVNYDRLNRSLEQWLHELDPSRRFWASSPCNGELDFGDAWHDDKKGDMHFWDVWHSGKSFDAYTEVTPRFCSEFGYQSWPSFSELTKFVPEEEWNIGAPHFENHQKNARGNSIITEMFTRYFRFPSDFEQMLYLSQVQQAIAIKTAVESWRSTSPICQGILYWQLNDNWPVSSWSSIEYSGRWKQFHYHVKRFFEPTLVCFERSDNALILRIINDSPGARKLSGKVLQLDWDGKELNQWNIDCTAETESNQSVWQVPLDSPSSQQGAFYYVDSSDSQHNFWLPDIPKKLPIKKANIDVRVEGNEVYLTSDKPALFVHLEHPAILRFSDSSFFLLPGVERRVTYQGELIDAEGLKVYQLAER